MSRNPALELLRNPKPYPHATNGSTPPRAKQPNRAADELRKPQQPYPQPGAPSQRPPQGGRQPPPNASQPRASQPRQGPPNASQPRPGQNQPNSMRNPQPYPTASQPQSRPRTPQSTGSSRPVTPQSYGTPAYSPPSASQPRTSPAPAQGRPGGVPQKKKPRVAVSMGAPKPYQPPRQASHVTPPVRTRPPTASQPPPGPRYQPRPSPGPIDSPSPRASPSPTQITPVVRTHPPSPQHSDIRPAQFEPVSRSQEYQPTYRNPPPVSDEPPPVANSRLTPTSGYDESDLPDDRDSKRSYGNEPPSAESDIESFGVSDRTPSPLPEKKMIEDVPVQERPVKQKSTSKLQLAPPDKGSDRRKVYGGDPCGGRCCLLIILAIIFIVLLAFALALGLGLSGRGTDHSGAFARQLNMPCDMVCEEPSKNGYSQRAVLMIALDGFRPEFLNDSWRDIIPNIHRLAECGVVATNMEPSYPSTTYPNLYTLITGLFPSVHGIFSDFMTRDGTAGAFDPRNDPQSPSLKDPVWYNGKPIWQTAKEQGVVTASHSWLGNNIRDYSVSGITVLPKPDYYVERNPSIDFHARIQSALNWFTLPSNKAKFVNIFIEEPGSTIRRHGISSNQVEEALAEVDDAIGLFMENLVRDDATNCFDIVLVSTNGQLDVSCDNTTYFDSILPNTLFYDTTSPMNSLAFLTPTSSSPTDSDTPEELLNKIGCNKGPFEAYTTDTVPPRYHLSNSDRHDAAVVIMDDWQTFAVSSTGFDDEECRGARGGYSTMNPEMKGMLLGFGPSFKSNVTFTEGFKNIEVYNLISDLIDVSPEENNGTLGSLNHLLKSPEMSLRDLYEDKNIPEFPPESGMCTYPSDAATINLKRNEADTGCQCTGITQQEINEKDAFLNKGVGQGDTLVREVHAPFGAPKVVEEHGAIGRHHCQLVQDNYMTMFENKLSIPLYVAFNAQRETPVFDSLDDCNRYDVRLEPDVSPKCSYYSPENPALPEGIEMAYLLPKSLARSRDEEFNILITSNMVPMQMDFITQVWNPITTWIRNLASGRDGVLVVAGPVYDTNRDGLRDTYRNVALWTNDWVGRTPVPTHFFIVLTICSDPDTDIGPLCDVEDLQVAAYIFPHTEGIRTCDGRIEDYMKTYQATVSEVEAITGLHFFSRIEEDATVTEEELKYLIAMKMSRKPFS